MTWRRAACGMVLFLASCLDLGTDPNEIGAISFDGIAYPSVVVGDTLRNEQGQVTPLRATVLSGAGDTVPNPEVQFFSRDTTVRLSADARVIGSLAGVARLFAAVGGLQSVTREIDVVSRPESALFVRAPDTMSVTSVDTTTNNSADFRVRLVNAAGSGVKGFLVRYVLEFRGETVAPGDTTRILMVDEAGRPSVLDTTDASGEGARRVHVRVPQLSGVTDSALVRFRVSAGAYPAVQTEFRRILRFRPRGG
ncbi:MAG: hypothetical protein ACREOG_21165 [Gemmatimonadaceae bacterium]